MNESSSSNRNVVEVLAEEFLQRRRDGEQPKIEEYKQKHPELAEEIEELFPALLMMEDLKPDDDATVQQTFHETKLESLGDYRIIREIGRGGMGIVYEAEQVSLGRRVALKVLPQSLLQNPKYRARFERESRAAAKLHHTNIVPVFGVGEDDGRCYYVMQFIHGRGLDDVLDELKHMLDDTEVEPPSPHDLSADTLVPGASSVALSSAKKEKPQADDSSPGTKTYWNSVSRIGIQVAEALDHAHQQGVLHRDVKPANLLLDTEGSVWVTDFGLAQMDDDRDLTKTGDILGTLRYMAPETFKGKADARSEIYSLGLTLYELLAMRPAFDQANRNQLVEQVMQGRVAPLSKRNPDIPLDLQTIVHKAIDSDPAHRYQTAGELAADLERYTKDEPIHARRLLPHERLLRWSRRNKGLAAALSTVVLLLAVAAVVSTVFAEYYQNLSGG